MELLANWLLSYPIINDNKIDAHWLFMPSFCPGLSLWDYKIKLYLQCTLWSLDDNYKQNNSNINNHNWFLVVIYNQRDILFLFLILFNMSNNSWFFPLINLINQCVCVYDDPNHNLMSCAQQKL